MTEQVALERGHLNAGAPLPVIDGLIAPTARVHALTLVTRNVTDVGPTGVAFLNPSEV